MRLRYVWSPSIWLCFSIFIIGLTALDYRPYHTPNCTALNQIIKKKDLSLLWNLFILHVIDQYVFIFLCPIIFILQVLIIVTFHRHESLLMRSGNVFRGLIFLELILNLQLLITSIYHFIFSDYQPMPNSFPPFCNTMSVIFIFFQVTHFSYLLMFLIYTVINFRFSLRKRPDKTLWWTLNITVFLISTGITTFLYLTNLTGLSYYGICQVTLAQQPYWNHIMPYISIGISILYTILGFLTLLYFRRHIPQIATYEKRKIAQTRTISLIVIGFSFFLLLLSIFELVLDLNCLSDAANPSLDVLVTIANLFRLAQYIFLIFIILRNSIFRAKLKHTIKKIFQSNDHPYVQTGFIQNGIDMEELAFDERLLRIKEKSNQIDLLLTLQIYTIITGVYILHLQYHKDSFNNEQELKEIHYRQRISFLLDNTSAMNYETESRVIVQLKILKCSVMLHAPRVFGQILQRDGMRNVHESFSVVENLKKIWNSIEGRGGKSGQFFYFSADNKFVLKTITIDQFQFLIKNLEQFVEYYNHNPDSVLAKIYGIYTIKGAEIQRTFRFILMKNILGCPKDQVLRIYDMKGSKHDRQVIKDIDQLQDTHKITLKDTDFTNFQGKLRISTESSSKLRDTLEKDTNFLKNLNLIDYSLLVVRVLWVNKPKQPQFWSDLQRIQHQEYDNQYYHIGVIDYMQKWDLQKKSEKWWKNFLGKRDVSAAAPMAYQTRFSQFVKEITNFLPPIELKEIRKTLKQKFKQQEGNQENQRQTYMVNVFEPNQRNSSIQYYFQFSHFPQDKPNKITRDSSDLRPRTANNF